MCATSNHLLSQPWRARTGNSENRMSNKLLVALLLLVPFAADAKKAQPIKAMIYFSAAPWDGAAYEILIPIKNTEGPAPTIRLNIWGNPEFQKREVFKFNGNEGSSTDRGRVSFQTELNKSMPQNMKGTVTFKRLKKGVPIVGAFDLETLKGQAFKGEFQAEWGN